MTRTHARIVFFLAAALMFVGLRFLDSASIIRDLFVAFLTGAAVALIINRLGRESTTR
jgi:hypothetical protein